MDRSSFDSFYRVNFPRVMRQAQLLGLPSREAPDVAQDVFIAFLRAVEQGVIHPEKYVAWLRKTMCYMVWARLAALKRAKLPGELDVMDDSIHGDSDRRVAVREQWELVKDLLEGLDRDHRAVFVLRELEELTFEEIAETLEIPLGTVASRLHSARVYFEEALRRRRAKDRRSSRGAAILLPLGASSLLRIARTLPSPEIPANAEAEVWARVQQAIGWSAPLPGRLPRLGKVTMTAGRLALAGGLTFIAGAVAGAAVLQALRSPPHPSAHARAPIVAVASVEEGTIPATLSTAIVATASPPTTPAATGVQSAASRDTAADERDCLEAARVKLGAQSFEPRAALRLLERCEQRYPRRAFPETHDQIRRQAREALARSGRKL